MTKKLGRATRPNSSASYLKVAALLAVLLLLVGFSYQTYQLAAHTTAITEQDLEQSARENVFRIMVITPFGISGGTGYLAKTKANGVVLLTNKHICDINPEDGIFILDQESTQYLSKVRRKAAQTDLCLLEPPAQFLAKYQGLSLASESGGIQLNEGEVVYVYGHPGLRPLTGTSGPFLNESWIPTIEGGDLAVDTLKIGRADVVIYPGSSGSPVLNEDGLVVGTIFAYEGSRPGGKSMALFIPLDVMIEFLNGGM